MTVDQIAAAFVRGETAWPNGSKSSKLKSVDIEGTCVAFSYGEPIAVRKPGHQIAVVGWGTLNPDMPGVFEWSMTTGRHIQEIVHACSHGGRPWRSNGDWRPTPKRLRRTPRRVTRQELHRLLGWPCAPLPAVVRVKKCGANARFGNGGHSFPKTISFHVDPNRPANQWDKAYMGENA